MRFAVEALSEVRRRVGNDFVVGARISGDEFTRDGLTAADMADIAAQRPPKGQRHRPDQIEILRGISAIRVGTKLCLGLTIFPCSLKPQEFVRI